MYKYILLAFFFVLGFGLKAQNLQQAIGRSALVRADDKFAAFDYEGAVHLYEKEYADNPDAAIAVKIANAYFKLQKRQQALMWLEAAEEELDDSLKYKMAVLYAHNHEEENALRLFETLGIGKAQLEGWKHFDAAMSSRYQVNAAMRQDNFNTYGSTKVQDGILFFSDKPKDVFIPTLHNWTGNAFPELYYAPITESGKIGKAKPASIDQLKDGFAGPLIQFGNMLIMGINHASTGKMSLYECRYEGEGQIIVAQPLLMDDVHYEGMHPAVYGDSLLVFAAALEGGYGGMDLYSSVYDGKSWSKPQNLGPEINTAGHEVFPYYSAANGLFFSSDGHPGFGGLDIYRIHNTDSTRMPVNLGPEINSSSEDFAYHEITAYRGFFSSSRNITDNIFSFKSCAGVIKVSSASGLNLDYLTVNSGEKVDMSTEQAIDITCKAGDILMIFFDTEEAQNFCQLEVDCTLLAKGSLLLDLDSLKPSKLKLSQ